jgi:hypothetical protein
MTKFEYVKVTAQEYGNFFDTAAARQLAADFELANWIAKREAREAYLKTPEGIAEQKRKQEEEDARYKREAAYRARFQWLHDKLVSKGCECNHDDCGY